MALSGTFVVWKNVVLLPKVVVILGGEVTMSDEDPGVKGVKIIYS